MRMLDDTTTMMAIPKAEYDSLKDDSRWRNVFESGGVDNWEGYEEAMHRFLYGEDYDV